MSRKEWKVSLPREAAPDGRTHMAFAAKFPNGRVESAGAVPTELARLLFMIICAVKTDQIEKVSDAVIEALNRPEEQS